MALFLSLLYIVLSYTKPEVFFPELANYRVALILGILAILFSLPKLAANQYLLRVPQTYFLLFLLGAICISKPLHGWVGGGAMDFGLFFPSIIVYFLIVANVDSWKRLKLVVVTVLLTTTFMAVQGIYAFYVDKGLPTEGSMLMTGLDARAARSTVFVVRESVDTGDAGLAVVYRLRSVGNLSDPNDFSQFLLISVPLLWLGWKKRKLTNNTVVLVTTAVILYTCFLTHSRGSMLGLAVILLVALKDKLGVAGSGVASGIFLALMMAVGFTGGRAVGDSAGRLAEWGNGLQLLKQSPLFGVGFGNFTDAAYDGGTYLTAHNSFVLCFTELGLTGYVCWLATIVIVFLGLNRLIRAARPPLPVLKEEGLLPADGVDRTGGFTADEANGFSDKTQKSRILKWGTLVRISLIAFLFTSWFLSRTYAVTLYLLLGIATALIHLGGENLEFELPPIRSWAMTAATCVFASIAVVYAFIRI